MINYKRFVLSLSFGNYLKADGGTDKIILEHQILFNHNNISFLHIAPVRTKIQKLKGEFYTLTADGVYFGIYPKWELYKIIIELFEKNYIIDCVFVHHLMNFDIEFVKKIFTTTSAPIYYYLHDLHSVCNQINFINSDGKYCGIEPVSYKKCHNCSFYHDQEKYNKSLVNLFSDVIERLQIIGPSQITLDIWKKTYYMFSSKGIVIPHQICEDYSKRRYKIEDKIRIAYVGTMTESKGALFWRTFVDNVNSNENMYELYYFGTSDNDFRNVNKIYVNADRKNPNAMTDALRKCKIDIVILWSTIPETYSYTYFESFAAGCYIITNKYSGNIASMVKSNGNGIVFDNQEDAISTLINKELMLGYLSNGFEYPKTLKSNSAVLDLLSYKNNGFKCPKYRKTYCFSIMARIIDFLYRIKYKKIKKVKV